MPSASLLTAISALALMSPSTITLDAIAATPALVIVTSPLIATLVATLLLLPTRILPLVSAANLL